jgi:hypothetical protein
MPVKNTKLCPKCLSKSTKKIGLIRGIQTGKESFTHAKLVSAYRSLRTNLPYLFAHKRYKQLGIENTTNSLDGGVFSPMKMLIKIHRRLSKSLKLKMVDDYLVRDKKK